MADLSSLTYSSLQTAIGDWLARSDLSANIPDFITLFEAEANRTLRTRSQETTILLYPQAGYTFTVTNAANNGSGLIRLSFTSTSTSTSVIQTALATGNEVFVQSVGGTTEANNTWIATFVSSAAIDLQQSTFVNTYSSGGQLFNNSGYAALPSDFLEARRVTWSGGPNRELSYVQPSVMRIYHPMINGADVVSRNDLPSMWTIEGANVIVRPVDVTALEFDYWQKIPSLATQSSSTNWLLTAHPDCYLAGSLAEAYVFQKDWDQAGIWKQRRDDQFDRITRLDQKQRGPSGSHIRPDMRGIIP
jgi:hypothetical protein